MPAVKGKGCGGRRKGAGRPPGVRNTKTLAVVAELERHMPDGAVLPSVFLTKIMNDETVPLPARIMCAAKVIPFIERRPVPAIPDEIPLMRHWSEEQWRDYDRRLKEDMLKDPWYYGQKYFELMDMPWPLQRSQEKLSKGTPPSDRWFAEMSPTHDHRAWAGRGAPWQPGERERLLQTPFSEEELARGWGSREESENDPEAA
jgi:hypothetical protein